MQVILQEKIANLGNVGDEVNVKPGFARNYLFPTDRAIAATPENRKTFEAKRAGLERAAAEVLRQAEARKEALERLSITISANASEEGKLFGSVGTRDIAVAITNHGIAVEKREVNLPEGPIRQVGEHEVHIQLHSDVRSAIKIKVVAE